MRRYACWATPLVAMALASAACGGERSVGPNGMLGNGEISAARHGKTGPILWSENGHYYIVVEQTGTWQQARAAAEAMKFRGVQGHLATITSEAENTFIATQLGTTEGAWLGGEQPPGSAEPDGGWQWITGEPWVYTNWDFGEPSNTYLGGWGKDATGQSEERLSYTFGGVAWNDLPDDPEVVTPRFIVEWDVQKNGPHAHNRPVFWAVNRHYYLIVEQTTTWQQARASAEAMKFHGVYGHLATITSGDENTFVTTQLGNTEGAWLGGEQPPGSSEPDGGWQWITGEPWVYTNWDVGEPSNTYLGGWGKDATGQSEERLSYTFGGVAWNDLPDDPEVVTPRFIVEWDHK